ncbi:putative bifunctional lysylphosphatidylglycerol flippase/synthetase [Roseimaritima ulvae]|uniref:Inner membrane protein YbhN n=1 Tax=Roseimaritima ulvae TaxID=980254 RepID=A0A5B9QLT8_9BACT|nr:UPF0104 family protein [Roseimaritima ulvae]QEG39988.1 Inner membrane protein YbhN [Roseimaritima ulvae]
MSPVWKTRIRNVAGPTLATVLFVVAVRLLIGEANKISWEEFRGAVLGVPRIYLLIAALLIAMNYVMLMAYDLLALRYLRRSLPLRRVALVGFLGYSLGNNLGTLIAAAPLRFHFYTRWGLSPTQIVALLAFLGLTFWSGLWFLGGTVLVFNPIPLPDDVNLPIGTRALGFAMLSLWIAYALSCAVWHKPIPVGGLKLRTPHVGLMGLQTSVAAVDLTISATALYLVLPADTIVPFGLVLAAYLVAIAIALITQVPGGLGVLELILLKLLAGTVGQTVLASVLIFRVLYYVLPLLVGILLMVVNELWEGAEQMRAANRKVMPPDDLPPEGELPAGEKLPGLDDVDEEQWLDESSRDADD